MGNYRNGVSANTPPVTLNLIIINVLCWLAAVLLPTRFGLDLTDMLGLHYWGADNFRIWQLLTYMFMHDTGGFGHIFFNMFGVWMFGRTLEQVWGGKKFLFFYFVAGVGAGVVQELTWMIDLNGIISAMNIAIESNSGEALVPYSYMFKGGNIADATSVDVIRLKQEMLARFVTVGASGSLFGVLLAFGWLFPEARMMLLFLPVPIPARVFVGIYAVIELFLGVANFSIDNIAHFAHLGGMLFGAVLLWIWKRKGKLYN